MPDICRLSINIFLGDVFRNHSYWVYIDHINTREILSFTSYSFINFTRVFFIYLGGIPNFTTIHATPYLVNQKQNLILHFDFFIFISLIYFHTHMHNMQIFYLTIMGSY